MVIYSVFRLRILKNTTKNGLSATNKILIRIRKIHDIESNMYMGSAISISNIIFKSHWVHLAIIFL
jgi:hypothetical protein